MLETTYSDSLLSRTLNMRDIQNQNPALLLAFNLMACSLKKENVWLYMVLVKDLGFEEKFHEE